MLVFPARPPGRLQTQCAVSLSSGKHYSWAFQQCSTRQIFQGNLALQTPKQNTWNFRRAEESGCRALLKTWAPVWAQSTAEPGSRAHHSPIHTLRCNLPTLDRAARGPRSQKGFALHPASPGIRRWAAVTPGLRGAGCTFSSPEMRHRARPRLRRDAWMELPGQRHLEPSSFLRVK